MTVVVLEALAGLIVGAGLGLIHFATLRRVAEGYVTGAPAARVIGLQLVRLAVVGAVLIALAVWSAAALIAAAIGIFVGREIVLRRARRS